MLAKPVIVMGNFWNCPLFMLSGGGVGDESVDCALALPRPLLLDALVERHLTHDTVQARPVAGLRHYLNVLGLLSFVILLLDHVIYRISLKQAVQWFCKIAKKRFSKLHILVPGDRKLDHAT